MMYHVVNNRRELCVAIKVSAKPTYEEARMTPVTIHLGSTVYRFKDGIHERRATQLIGNIRKQPAKAFDVCDA